MAHKPLHAVARLAAGDEVGSAGADDMAGVVSRKLLDFG